MSINVIYLDDEPMLCELFSEFFSSDDIIITTFTDVYTAIDEIKKNPPDLIFIDFRLPGMNGDQVALQLAPSIPKFLITGDIDVETAYKFTKVIPKPYKRDEISSILNEALSLKK